MNVYFALSPLLVVGVGGLLVMLAESFGASAAGAGDGPDAVVDPGAQRGAELGLLSALVLFVGAIFSAALWMAGPESIAGATEVAPYLLVDRFSVFFWSLLCATGGIVALLGGAYLPEHQIERGEFFSLVVLSTVGAMALCAAGDLITLFIALEAMSLGVYAMVGLRRESEHATEAALKLLLLGSFATAIMLFAGTLLYGATGHTALAGIGESIQGLSGDQLDGKAGLILVGLGMMLAGLVFKVGAVPFHMWAPDAYEGAPTPVAGYMVALVKSAAFALLLRVLFLAFADERLSTWGSGWPPVLTTLALLSMFGATMVAGRQESVKRMLAYSSVAHAGYALVGVVAASRGAEAQASVLVYLLGYALSTVGAFGALTVLERKGKDAISYEDLAGLGKRSPAAALGFTLFLVSLAGVPPTIGFLGKLAIFQAAIESELYLFAVLGLLSSVIGAYCYLKAIVFMYMKDPKSGAAQAEPMSSGYLVAALLIAALLVLGLGLFPETVLTAASSAVLF